MFKEWIRKYSKIYAPNFCLRGYAYTIVDFRGLKKEQEVLLTHGDSLDGVAEGFKAIAHSGPLIAGKS